MSLNLVCFSVMCFRGDRMFYGTSWGKGWPQKLHEFVKKHKFSKNPIFVRFRQLHQNFPKHALLANLWIWLAPAGLEQKPYENGHFCTETGGIISLPLEHFYLSEWAANSSWPGSTSGVTPKCFFQNLCFFGKVMITTGMETFLFANKSFGCSAHFLYDLIAVIFRVEYQKLFFAWIKVFGWVIVYCFLNLTLYYFSI